MIIAKYGLGALLMVLGVSASATAPQMPAGLMVRVDAHGQRETFRIDGGTVVRDDASAALAVRRSSADGHRVVARAKSELDDTSSRAAWYYGPSAWGSWGLPSNYFYSYYGYNYYYQPCYSYYNNFYSYWFYWY